MKYSILFLLLFSFKLSYSQVLYLDKGFSVSKKTSTYKTINYAKKLKFDFYKPRKAEGELPLLIYVHGGGFSGGKRNSKNVVRFAKQMAGRGYAVASVSYRLTMQNIGFGCATNSTDKINAFNDASEDISLAVKFIIDHKEKYNIDARKIILIGTSAGAEAILNLAYVYNNKILPSDFKFAGIISMAGAVTTIENITHQNAIPTQLFHGINDKIVPYNVASHHYCSKKSEGYLVLYGSKAIADKLKNIGKSYYLYSVKKGDHSWSIRPIIYSKPEIIDFLYYDVLKQSKRQIETFI
ncbi:carboxylesterase family protein [uncultured Polaribacter sp.]|uniref:alpha/beta hydrolase n=1 Tax=uncultured Polaribacter sp. TaxID=174711 RepID=UPI0030D9DE2C|tara:strand:+ start:2583 stop:3470 length:888 start_codon:yes stop_codon:yes gene_type:complete